VAEQWLPRGRILKDVRNHFVLANSVHYVRALTLDARGHSMIDHESIEKEFDVTDPTLATIESVYSDDQQRLLADYDKKKIIFGDTAGFVQIQVSSPRYNHNFMRQPTKTSSQADSAAFSLWSSNKATNSSKQFLFQEGLFLPTNRLIQDRLNVNIVHNVDIEPKQKTIYFSKQRHAFKFSIKHGSGEFLVALNDSSVAEK